MESISKHSIYTRDCALSRPYSLMHCDKKIGQEGEVAGEGLDAWSYEKPESPHCIRKRHCHHTSLVGPPADLLVDTTDSRTQHVWAGGE